MVLIPPEKILEVINDPLVKRTWGQFGRSFLFGTCKNVKPGWIQKTFGAFPLYHFTFFDTMSNSWLFNTTTTSISELYSAHKCIGSIAQVCVAPIAG